MEFMKEMFQPYLDSFVIVFIDDILVYSKTDEDHVRHLRTVLQRLREEKLYAKYLNCEFSLDFVEFLGYVVSKEGIQWSDECEERFQKLKTLLTSALVLTLPEKSVDFTVYCDTFGVRLVTQTTSVVKPAKVLYSASVELLLGFPGNERVTKFEDVTCYSLAQSASQYHVSFMSFSDDISNPSPG
ncbi:uncharacterized protein [Solanum tuberosum]|uniref:uncharacterized protein n=1 Tax=Solanum tuberosum TaxID=4113 RepID=UPI00073A2EA2|nr:PREDICTED: uncharacterized protein LOC107062308 [Solanum tuberosum]